MTMSYEKVTDAHLKRLLDREEISDVQLRYATAVDSRDWELFRTCFADEVEADYSSVFGTPPARLGADEFVAMIAPVMSTLTATQHMITNLAVTVEGENHATVVAYVRAIHHNAKRPPAAPSRPCTGTTRTHSSARSMAGGSRS